MAELTQPEADELAKLMRACNTVKPERADREALRKYFVAHPAQTWNIGIASLALQGALSNLGVCTLEECSRAGIDRLRKELEYARSPALERLAIDHLVLCWIHYHDVVFVYDSKMAKGMTFAEADFWERKLTAVQRRYVRALESLARLRRLKLPVMQVNVAGQQVNVAG
ncbi:MAG TPA: hypothetical protein VHI13_04505 [Candidatus Kapabacteria bacterium]|nr:hypothetical protein [Candidatus Kapabacteria bacterium]